MGLQKANTTEHLRFSWSRWLATSWFEVTWQHFSPLQGKNRPGHPHSQSILHCSLLCKWYRIYTLGVSLHSTKCIGKCVIQLQAGNLGYMAKSVYFYCESWIVAACNQPWRNALAHLPGHYDNSFGKFFESSKRNLRLATSYWEVVTQASFTD